jgi:large subunit ribosomal protein L31e
MAEEIKKEKLEEKKEVAKVEEAPKVEEKKEAPKTEKKVEAKSKKEKVVVSEEQVYTIPLRGKFRHAARYKKTPKAIKSIKEFLVRHMKVYDRDLSKIKLDNNVNEFIWGRGIKNPPHKIKVKVVKEGDIVNVSLFEMTKKLTAKRGREAKRETKAETSKKKAKVAPKGVPRETSEEVSTKGKKPVDADKDGVADKKEEKEKKSAVVEAGQDQAKAEAKQMKHDVGGKTKQPKRPVRNVLNK